MTQVRVAHPVEVLFGDGVALACGLDGDVRADHLHGLFAGDTRVLSTHRLTIGGRRWHLLSRHRSGHGTASWHFQNPAIRDAAGDIDAGSLFLSVRRRVGRALHDDWTVVSFGARPTRARLVVQLDADFADIFEVKDQRLPPRLDVRRVLAEDGFVLTYQRRGFRRALHVRFEHNGAPPQLVGSLAVFDLELAANEPWECCMVAEPEVDDHRLSFAGDPHADEDLTTAGLAIHADPMVQGAFERGVQDLCALALPGDDGQSYVGAGVPWFLTLFGRDALMTALLSGVLGSWPAEGGLSAVSAWQAVERDDWRDAEPGKLPHELRRGELAHDHRIPHTPYYGTHDAPALFCLALWHAWRWSGRVELLDAHLDTALRGLTWCDEHGDRDGDGLQEYGTRSRAGYYNQSWKDAGDAILHEDGSLAELPIATVELQAYLIAARLAMAELLAVRGETERATHLREGAASLRALTESRFWLGELGTYAMALDGRKRPVTSASSNPGHLLWAGVVSQDRAAAVARRLLAPDLFSGWGVRTLSADHTAYNPLSYQRGSVWPHDSLLAAAGMWRYGLRQEACVVLRALFEAADAFEDSRLPELFCGFDRSLGLPVPYIEANIPQAWAASVPLAAVQLLLGLIPDAPRKRCYLAPWLPDWLPSLEVHGLRVGAGRFDVGVVRRGATTEISYVRPTDIDVVTGTPPAPLWGAPMFSDDP